MIQFTALNPKLSEVLQKIKLNFALEEDSPIIIRFKDNEEEFLTIVKQEDLDIALIDFKTKELYLYEESFTKLNW